MKKIVKEKQVDTLLYKTIHKRAIQTFQNIKPTSNKSNSNKEKKIANFVQVDGEEYNNMNCRCR